jgi:outer membrane receptor protein involved in Fe transport
LGEPAISVSAVNDNYSPARTKTIRFAGLAQNSLFSGRAQSSSILGADYSRVKSAFISYRFYEADQNWNTILDAAGNRIQQGRLIWPLGTTPQTYLPEEHTSRATFFGKNYNRELANPVDSSLVGPDNPLGVAPGGAAHYLVKDINKGIFAANTTEWLGGRLQTLAGVRFAKFYKLTQNQGTAPTALNPDIQATRLSEGTSSDYNIGLNYGLTDWLRPYASASSSYNPPAIQLNGPYGDTVQPAKSRGYEAGLKFQGLNGRVSGSLSAYYVDATNEFNVIQTALVTAINPPGINGRFGNPSTMINVDRQTKGAQLTLTANPTRDLRSRFSFGWTDGSIRSGKSYPLLYNDQFYTNSQGQVTYRNGTVVYVRPTFSAAAPVATPTTAGAFPLTVAMMNTPGGVYYANPRDISGAILTTSNVGRVLAVVDPANGPVRTGAVGLPISQIQINPGFTPPSSIEVARSGDLTTGYPTWGTSFTNVYNVSSGPLKGLKIGGTGRIAWDLRRYYHYVATVAPGEPRELFRYPTMVQFDGILGYSRKFGRYTWSTQLNVANLFNQYDVLITPNAATGYGGVKSAVLTQQPRSYLWTNTISF